MKVIWAVGGGCVLASATVLAQAADAERGARLYLQLADGAASCVSCHGPDPAGNRNNILRAAGRADVLLRTLNTVGVMGYLRSSLAADDLDDLAAYLDAVARAAADAGRTAWPRTIEFGTLAPGAASPVHQVRLRNLSAQPLVLAPPRLARGIFELTHDCPAQLAPAAECRASLRAVAGAPTAPGSFTDTLVWPAPVPVLVGMAATVAEGPQAVLSADAGSVDFGSVDVGSTAVRQLALRNSGTADATLGVATLTGPGAGAVMLDGGCAAGSRLAPGLSCTLELRFRPGAEAAYAATLQWRSDGAHPATVQLAGQGRTAAAPPAPVAGPTAPGAGDGGGGCAAGAAGRADASLPLWLAAALAALTAGRLRQQRGRRPAPHEPAS